ncbi:hypothetical protein GCM10027599_11270 [Yimella radicis]
MSDVSLSAESNRAVRRRTLVSGAAWSAPIIVMGTPAAMAGISQCTVDDGSLTLGPKVINNLRAVCSSQSQLPTGATTIVENYGKVYGPAYLEICNCTTTTKWYRWRETDSLSNFQIEIDGVHNDQNSSTQGYRPAIKLQPVNSVEGACQRFNITYRTSAGRRYSTNTTSVPGSSFRNDFTIAFVLQVNNSTSENAPTSGWSNVPGGTFTATGLSTWRTVSNPDFTSCQSQGVAPAQAKGADAATDSTDGNSPETPAAPTGNGD